jgi:predicted alpha-1,2-mannosidase
MKFLFFLPFIISPILTTAQEKNTSSQTKKLVEANSSKHSKESILNYVNPFIGTGGHGHTYPGASAPFGMMQLSPDTRYNGWDGCSGYHYSDSIIYGFSHTHLSGTGVEDYCDILVVPQIGRLKQEPEYLHHKEGYGSTFSHSNEKASPGYYSVKLDNGIFAEFTVSQRAGIHHYIFPQNTEKKYILVDLTHRDRLLKYDLKQISATEFSGARVSSSWAKEQYQYFHLNTSVAPIAVSYDENKTKLILEFPATLVDLEIKIGLSAVNENGAAINLNREIGEKSFAEVKELVEQEWKKELSAVTVSRTDKNAATIFYTALYHSYLAPNVFSDLNNEYRGLDQDIHKVNDQAKQYTVFSLWDTYRATHPWYTLFQQRRTIDFIRSFENHYLHSGDLPVWELAGNETNCMIGYHSASVIADAYIKGIKQIDVPLFVNALETTANLDEFGKRNFNEQGFIDYKAEPESVSKTLEYAYDSYCIYTFLKAAKEDGFKVKEGLIDVFYNRSFNFINIFDPQTGFMRARNGGIWHSPFKPEEVNFNFTEANSWQYSLYAPHAIPVLTELLGGKAALQKWLDQLFAAKSDLAGNHQADITGLIGQYAHGNEPSHHMAYLYNYTDAPEKTAVIVDSVLHHYYHNAPDGLSGNEDCGQMSSWYTFSSLGLYPVSPGSGIYDFGRPIFTSAELLLENSKRIRILTINNSRENKFIQSIKVDGTVYKKRYITHQMLLNIKTLEFTMGPLPSSEYRSYEIAPSIDSIPDSFVPVPHFKNDNAVFTKQTTIEIKGIGNELFYFYTTDGSIPTIKSKKYKKPIKIKASTTIKVIAYNPETKESSKVISNDFILKDQNVKLTLKSPYKPQYSASGNDALIDQLYGTKEFRSGDWQGFYNVDAEGTVDFSKPKQLQKIGLSALQSTRSWIFPPKSVNFIVHYQDNTTSNITVDLKEHPTLNNTPEKSIKYEFTPENKPVKSITFKAFNYGENPTWHLSPGYPTYIFLDELYFE